MKFPVKKQFQKPTVPKPQDDANPPGIASIDEHPWSQETVVRLWHREGSQRGIAEVVIQTAAGKLIRGSMKQLPGFFEASVKRPGKRLKP
jgi:hypothetical protein